MSYTHIKFTLPAFIILVLLLVGENSFGQKVVVSSGTVTRFENFTSKYVDPRNVDVWLPDNYSNSKKYAVFYMQDGQMLFDSTHTWTHQEWGVDETLGKLMKEKKIRDCIVVGIWNIGEKRHAEYCPQKPVESLSSKQLDTLYTAKNPYGQLVFGNNKINSDNYLKFLINELKPFIDSTFSTLKDQQNTFIAGSSMGGLISFYAICEYPNVFGGAACLSTHWTVLYRADHNPAPAAIFEYMKNHLPSPKDHKIYFDHGTTTLDTLYAPFQKEADEVMKAHGYTSKNWETKVFNGESHSEQSWRKRFDIPALFLLKK